MAARSYQGPLGSRRGQSDGTRKTPNANESLARSDFMVSENLEKDFQKQSRASLRFFGGFSHTKQEGGNQQDRKVTGTTSHKIWLIARIPSLENSWRKGRDDKRARFQDHR
jgi:hypothetical protein